MKNIKKCICFLKNSKKQICIIVILSILINVISIIIPAINGYIINCIMKCEYNYAIILVFVAGLIQILNTICNLIISNNYLLCKKNMLFNIRKKIFVSILNFKLDTTKISGHGTILNKIRDDSKNIALYLNNIKDSVILSVTNLGVLIYVFYINIILGVFYILILLISLLIRYYGIKKSLKYEQESYLESDKSTSLINEVLSGSNDIKTLSLKNKFYSKNNILFNKIGELEFRSNKYYDYTSKIARLMESLSSGIMILISIYLLKNNLLTISNFVIIFMYKSNIFNFITKFSSLVSYTGKFNLSCNRLFSIIDYNQEEYGNIEKNKLSGNIEFKDVSFGYNNKLLNKINMKIEANSFNVIIGKNGVGKTTIFNLLTKLISKDAGKILLDGVDIDELTEDSIRNNIASLSQQPYLFNMSIEDNLNIVDGDLANIKKICKCVEISDKIESMKEGYHTIIGEGGCCLSGGERQKIALARALLLNTKILLLDEVTNNLDIESVKSITNLLKKIKGKYTIIVISHNNDLNKYADNIFALENHIIKKIK